MKAAVYGATRNVYIDMIPSIKSLLANSDVDKVYLLTEDNNLLIRGAPYKLPKECEVVNVSKQQWFKPDGANYAQEWTWMTLMRIALPFLFPELDRIVWLDNDTICRSDVSDLWDFDLEDCYVGGVEEPNNTQRTRHLYINAGVLYFDLKRLRESGKAAEMIDVLHRQKFPFPDQDVINCLCQGYIKTLPVEYNSYAFTGTPKGEKIKHYAGWKQTANKNWRQESIVSQYREMSWDDIEKIRKEKYGKETETEPVNRTRASKKKSEE